MTNIVNKARNCWNMKNVVRKQTIYIEVASTTPAPPPESKELLKLCHCSVLPLSAASHKVSNMYVRRAIHDYMKWLTNNSDTLLHYQTIDLTLRHA